MIAGDPGPMSWGSPLGSVAHLTAAASNGTTSQPTAVPVMGLMPLSQPAAGASQKQGSQSHKATGGSSKSRVAGADKFESYSVFKLFSADDDSLGYLGGIHMHAARLVV